MKITRLHAKNFWLFDDLSLELDPNVTLLIGDNGSGKTSVLEALSIVAGIWLYDVPDTKLANSRRSLTETDIRLYASASGDRTQFRQAQETIVSGWGELATGHADQWTQEILLGKKTKVHLKDARDFIKKQYEKDKMGEQVLFPVIGYYGAGRAWLPHNDRGAAITPSMERARRWAAFYDCLNERIRFTDLRQWFWKETAEQGNRVGRERPGFEIVKQAILRCVPGATRVWFDTDQVDIVMEIEGEIQPSANMSAGQRMMLGLVADIAIKCVTQNNFLISPDQLAPDDLPLAKVLKETPGVILIDEVDVHLHPTWQRRVISDLVRTFPSIQFVCTTHSPQILGEMHPEQVYRMEKGQPQQLHQSYGLESGWLLDHAMNAASMNQDVAKKLKGVEESLSLPNLKDAASKLDSLRILTGPTPEVVRLQAAIDRFRRSLRP